MIFTIAAYIVAVVCILLVSATLLFDIADCNYVNTLKEKAWVDFCSIVVSIVCVGSLYVLFMGLF